MNVVPIGEWQNSIKRKKDALKTKYEQQIMYARGVLITGINIIYLGACSSIAMYLCVRAIKLALQ